MKSARMLREAALTLAVSVLYFAAAKLGLSMAFASEQVTLVWPPSGIALAAILRFGPRVWPGIALGALAANATAGESMLPAAGICVGNTLEAIFAAWLLGRSGFDARLERVRDAFAFVTAAVLASPVIASTIGVGSLCLLGGEPWSRFDQLWLLWWMGDAIGILLIAPPFLTWSRRPRGPLQLERILEAAGLAIALALVGIRIFAWQFPTEIEPLAFLVFPLVIWTALRFQQRGITLVVLFIAIVAVWGTLRGLGPFATDSPNKSLFLLQTFMAVVALTGLAFGASTAERSAAATRLAENLVILKAVTEGTTDAIFVKDPQGRYLMINSAGARATGKTVDEIIGRDDREIFSRETAAEIRSRDERIMSEGRTETFEERITASGEATRTFLSTKGPYFDENGAVIGLIGISRDITGLKAGEDERAELLQREQALRAAADRSNRQKDEFLGLLGHELRNPLAPIRNGLEILKQDSSEKTVGWALEVMERQVHHLSRLVDDLLDVSRITSGRIELRRELTDLRRVLERSIEVSDPILRSREHALALSLPVEPLRIVADVTRLEQVFVNLLNNAAKYTEAGGRIAVEAKRQGEEAWIFVRDTGRGISAELLPRVFDLFTQADSSLARSEGGLGVGLALVRKLVELHGGSVSASSEGIGRGSEFQVRLPLAPADVGRPFRPADRPQAQGRSLKVLLVEDNVDSSRSLAKLLSLFGHEVLIAEDGRSAVDAAETFDPAVVLLDIGLPGLNGYEVARRLRSRGSKAILVSLTGYGRDSDRAKSAEAGCDHHLVKPVEPETLRKLFASIARG